MKNKHYIKGLILIQTLLLCSCGPQAPTTTSSITSDSTSNISTNPTTSNDTTSDTTSDSTTTIPLPEYDVNYYDNYYSSLLSWNNSEDLLDKLYDILHENYVPLTFTGNWLTNQNADQDLANYLNVDLVYSDNDDLKTNTNSGSSGWQREHAFPASLMTGQTTGNATKTKGIATDFHNLWASNASANTSRGNLNYGNVSDEELLGTNNNCRYSSDKFEPQDVDKGKLARSIFYIATMYNDTEHGIFLRSTTCSIGEKCTGNVDDLLSWNSFIVDRHEYQHNSYVNEVQGNRNPFVDYPGLVDYAFGDKADVPGQLKYLKPTFLSLDLGSSSHSNYALSKAKTEYKVGEEFDIDDIEMVDVSKNFESTIDDISTYTIEGITDSYVFEKSDVENGKDITITKDDETVVYHINVKDITIESCLYNHIVTGKAAGQDFADYSPTISDATTYHNGVDNPVMLGSVKFNAYWENGYVGTGPADSNKGTQFGTSTKSCKKVYFETFENFSLNDKTLVKSCYVRANVASGETAVLEMFINNILFYRTVVNYDSTGSNIIYGTELKTPIQGKIKIEFSGLKKALYVKQIGIDAQ